MLDAIVTTNVVGGQALNRSERQHFKENDFNADTYLYSRK